MVSRTQRIREFIEHHYFAEAVVAYIFGLVSTWTPSSWPIRLALTFLSAVFLVAAIISKRTSDRKTAAERQAMIGAIRSLGSRTAKEPMIQAVYSWTENEPKDKPFTFINAGDDEARNIRIHPITLADREANFEPVAQLLPGASSTREADVDGEVGPLFRTLIDAIDHAINVRSRDKKARIPADVEGWDRVDRLAGAESEALDELENIEVIITYENRKGVTTTLEYRLNVTAFANVSRAELHLVRQR
jgi:hypothetical protein